MLECSILSFDFSRTAQYILVGELLHVFFVVLFLVKIIIIEKKNLIVIKQVKEKNLRSKNIEFYDFTVSNETLLAIKQEFLLLK